MHRLAFLAIALIACARGPFEVSASGATTTNISVPRGSVVQIQLQSVGPGAYLSPPLISSAVLRFDTVAVIGPPIPSGQTQEFRFRAVAAGRAIVTFSHSDHNAPVTDTITVR